MEKRSTILVVGASREDFDGTHACLPDWECTPLDLDEEGASIKQAETPAPSVMVVYAQKDPAETFSLCRKLRNAFSHPAVPILLAGGRYDIGQSSSVSQMYNAGFVITPLSETPLRAKLAELIE